MSCEINLQTCSFLQFPDDKTCSQITWWKSDSPEASKYASIKLSVSQADWTQGIEGEEVLKWDGDSGIRRMSRVLTLRQQSLDYAREKKLDFMLILDGDVLIDDTNLLRKLLNVTLSEENVGATAGFISASNEGGNFLNFIDPERDLRTLDSQTSAVVRDWTAGREVFDVHFVFGAVLLRANLISVTFNPDLLSSEDQQKLWAASAPFNEMVVLAFSIRYVANMNIKLLREKLPHGYMPSRQIAFDNLQQERDSERSAKLSAVRRAPLFNVSAFESAGLYTEQKVAISKLPGIDEVFVINLVRRPEKRRRMQYLFDNLGINATFVAAYDGETLDMKAFQSRDVGLPPSGYLNVYARDGKRHIGITAGSAALTFTSVDIWKAILQRTDIKNALILEDDCHFTEGFRRQLHFAMEELKEVDSSWDLLYIGRKSLKDYPDTFIAKDDPTQGHYKQIVIPGYSHWTIGMVLSHRGAAKLLAGEPYKFIVPLDEYIPLMGGLHFDNDLIDLHPASGSMRVYGLQHQLVEPMRYSSEQGHISDTEDYIDTVPLDWMSNGEEVKAIAQNPGYFRPRESFVGDDLQVDVNVAADSPYLRAPVSGFQFASSYCQRGKSVFHSQTDDVCDSDSCLSPARDTEVVNNNGDVGFVEMVTGVFQNWIN